MQTARRDDPRTFAVRLRGFRVGRALSAEGLALLLDTSASTIRRWEASASRPTPEMAARLQSLGFGRVDPEDTKVSSRPVDGTSKPTRSRMREKLRFGETSFAFRPSPYVTNGAPDQLPFYERLLELQEQSPLVSDPNDYARRLSLVSSVEGLVDETAQHALEQPGADSKAWNSNYGPHGWHRYVGRFPPHLVRSLLNHFGARPGQVVCDPFSGSGTTLLESRLLGLHSVGIEICPLSAVLSRTKGSFPTDISVVDSLMARFLSFFTSRRTEFALAGDLGSYERIMARRGNLVPEFDNYKRWLIPEALLGVSIAVEFIHSLEGIDRDLMTTVLSSQMRSIGNVDVDVVRAEYRKTPRSSVDVAKLVVRRLQQVKKSINDSIVSHDGMLAPPSAVQVIEGSLLEAEIGRGEVDFMVTSPPYGTESVSYLRTHLLSYRTLHSILGHNPYEYDSRIIGSEYLPTRDIEVRDDSDRVGSPTFSTFFRRVRGSAPDKLRMRILMMSNFFADMAYVGDRFANWLRPGGRLALVIGNKRIGEDVIPTHEIMRELLEARGLRHDSTFRHKLKWNNSNSEVPWQERTIQEEFVMLFTNQGGE